MSAEIINGPFWSNCFLEAAKAKNPSSIQGQGDGGPTQ